MVGVWLFIQTCEPPPPISVATPPLWDVIGYGNGDQTIWPYCLPTWLCGQRTVKPYPSTSIREYLLVSNSPEKQPIGRFFLDLGWHSLLWIMLTDTESSPFSSPIITTSHHLRGISPLVQPRSESKLFCFFAMVSSSFARSASVLKAGMCQPLYINIQLSIQYAIKKNH